jgi:hypothetical protein
MGGYNLTMFFSIDGFDISGRQNDFLVNFDWKSTINCFPDSINIQFFTSSSSHTYLAWMGGYNLTIFLLLMDLILEQSKMTS